MKTCRIELAPLAVWRDARGEAVIAQAQSVCNIKLDRVVTRDVYTLVSDCSDAEAAKIAELLHNPVLQMWRTGEAKSANFAPAPECDYLLCIGFKPGVTDNVSRTFRSAAADILGRKLREDEYVFSSTEYLISGKDLTEEQVKTIGSKLLANELIQTVKIFPASELDGELPLNMPRINAVGSIPVKEYNLEVSDDELVELSKKGTLALTLEEMKAIQGYFRVAEGRSEYGLNANPTDVELEVLP